MSYQGSTGNSHYGLSTVLQIKTDINFSSTDLYHYICELGQWVCVCGGEGWGGEGHFLFTGNCLYILVMCKYAVSKDHSRLYFIFV